MEERLSDEQYLAVMKSLMEQRLSIEDKIISLEVAHRMDRNFACEASYAELGRNLVVGKNWIGEQIRRMAKRGRLRVEATYRGSESEPITGPNRYDMSHLRESSAYQSSLQAQRAKALLRDEVKRETSETRRLLDALPECEEAEDLRERFGESVAMLQVLEQRQGQELGMVREIRRLAEALKRDFAAFDSSVPDSLPPVVNSRVGTDVPEEGEQD